MKKQIIQLVLFSIFIGAMNFVMASEETDPEAKNAQKRLQAVWQKHASRFFYSSPYTFYSCDGIERAVEEVLQDLGAKDVKANAVGCGYGEVQNTIPVRVTYSTLTTKPNAVGEPVDARFVELDFSKLYRRSSTRRGGSYCELIDDIERKLIENFEHETIRSPGICSSASSSLNNVRWKIKVLKPLS